jgi:hypothetical protein
MSDWAIRQKKKTNKKLITDFPHEISVADMLLFIISLISIAFVHGLDNGVGRTPGKSHTSTENQPLFSPSISFKRFVSSFVLICFNCSL